MLTLQPQSGVAMLPTRENNIPLPLFTFKQAMGFVIWNNLYGAQAEFYLMKFQRQDHTGLVARFFGGTAIPFPHSLRSTGTQSLIRLAEYLGIDLPENAGDGFIHLHTFMKTETTVHEQVDVANAREVKIPVLEVHGLLPAEPAFIEAHRGKLEKVMRLIGPRVDDSHTVITESDLPFNDSAMLPILHHLLAEGIKLPESRQRKTVENPAWAIGDYTPRFDTGSYIPRRWQK